MAQMTCKDCGELMSTAAKACPKCGRPNSRTSAGTLGCLIVILVAVIGIIIATASSGPSPSASSQSATPQKPQTQAYADQFVKITKFSWQRGGFDTVMIANLTVKNSGLRDVKDLRLKCEAVGKSGTAIASPSVTLYDIVPAGESKRFHDVSVSFISPQAARAGCEVADLTMLP